MRLILHLLKAGYTEVNGEVQPYVVDLKEGYFPPPFPQFRFDDAR
jgi:hypothetical protein